MIGVELSHLYGDQPYGPQQRAAACLVRELDVFRAGNALPMVLVDDYHGQPCAWSPARVADALRGDGLAVGAVSWEGAFAAAAMDIVRRLPTAGLSHDGRQTKFRPAGERGFRVARGDRPCCAALSAAWLLCRLGILPWPAASVDWLGEARPGNDSLVTVLPGTFLPTERQTCHIVAAAGHGLMLSRLEYVFFDAADTKVTAIRRMNAAMLASAVPT
jgi:hypothetical protein